jgi:hypothetical protein
MMPAQRFQCVYSPYKTYVCLHLRCVVNTTDVPSCIVTSLAIAMAKAKCHAAHLFLASIQPVAKAGKLADDVTARNPRTATKPHWADTTLEQNNYSSSFTRRPHELDSSADLGTAGDVPCTLSVSLSLPPYLSPSSACCLCAVHIICVSGSNARSLHNTDLICNYPRDTTQPLTQTTTKHSATMADPKPANDASPTVVPTAIHLAPRFPYPEKHGAASGPSSRNPSATTTDSFTSALSHEIETPASSDDAKRSSTAALPPLRSDINTGARPHTLTKSATERPRPTMRGSLLGRRKAASGAKKPELERSATVSFDPYSSSSSSDTEDEQEAKTAAIVDREKQKQDAGQDRNPAKEKRKSESGPFSKFTIGNDQFNTKGKVSKKDGRLKLSINETMNKGYFAKTLGAGLKKHFNGGVEDMDSAKDSVDGEATTIEPEEDEMEDPATRLKLNIVVIVIGSRGDIQPFIKIGKILKEDYGHRVRIATHPAFKEFVEKDAGLEFFSVGGDPSELMAFMVKNPGLIPSVETIKEGEIGRRRAAMFEMFKGMWRACINSTDDESDVDNMKMSKSRFVGPVRQTGLIVHSGR